MCIVKQENGQYSFFVAFSLERDLTCTSFFLWIGGGWGPSGAFLPHSPFALEPLGAVRLLRLRLA